MGLADLGSHHLRVGYTLPSSIIQEMDRINASAAALNLSITSNMTDTTARQSWYTWLGGWNAYYEKKSSPFWRYSVVSQARSDEWRDEVNAWAHELDRWYATYEASRTPSGQPLPVVPGAGVPAPIPTGPTGQGEDKKPWFGIEVPWWGWVMITLGAGAVAFSIYKAAEAQKENSRMLLGAFGGAAGGAFPAAFAHDQVPGAAPVPATMPAPTVVINSVPSAAGGEVASGDYYRGARQWSRDQSRPRTSSDPYQPYADPKTFIRSVDRREFEDDDGDDDDFDVPRRRRFRF